jgi:hypothetical protein
MVGGKRGGWGESGYGSEQSREEKVVARVSREKRD